MVDDKDSYSALYLCKHMFCLHVLLKHNSLDNCGINPADIPGYNTQVLVDMLLVWVFKHVCQTGVRSVTITLFNTQGRDHISINPQSLPVSVSRGFRPPPDGRTDRGHELAPIISSFATRTQS